MHVISGRNGLTCIDRERVASVDDVKATILNEN